MPNQIIFLKGWLNSFVLSLYTLNHQTFNFYILAGYNFNDLMIYLMNLIPALLTLEISTV